MTIVKLFQWRDAVMKLSNNVHTLYYIVTRSFRTTNRRMKPMHSRVKITRLAHFVSIRCSRQTGMYCNVFADSN